MEEKAPLYSSISGDLKPLTIFLHGTLEIIIHEAQFLPNLDLFTKKLDVCFACVTVPLRQRGHKVKGITSDPYTSIYLGDARVGRTGVIKNNTFPVWEEKFIILVAHSVSSIKFVIKDADIIGSELIGYAFIPANRITEGQDIQNEWFEVLTETGRLAREGSRIKLSVHYERLNENIGRLSESSSPYELYDRRNAYFPPRRGCRVTFYQDAHVNFTFRPEIKLSNGNTYQLHKCWEDICRTIIEAQCAIYITGWSIHSKLQLIRDPKSPLFQYNNLTLGEILKRKAKNGVRVLILVWDDATSINNRFVPMGGLMATHDEETRKYFRHTPVRCVLASRAGDSHLTWFKKKMITTMFTHHQKSIVVDSNPENEDGKRPLIAFIGGIDLTNGRYDDQKHSLFHTLHTDHANDFMQNNLNVSLESGGPREPWHDVHCKIEGPAAWDVAANFEQRWKYATRFKRHRFHRHDLRYFHESPLILHPRTILQPMADDVRLHVMHEEDEEAWSVQIFRSIDSGSVRGFPTTAAIILAENLFHDKNLAVDKSIQHAYIEAIRRANKFIYIENQYFLGSSYAWESHTNVGADHTIPLEIALKIAAKIKAGERFSAYVLIPMWPEGYPDSASVQVILYWQTQTMKMMYGVIADAIRRFGPNQAHPRDYLSFFCLGNREPEAPEDPDPTKPPGLETPEGRAYAHRRQMVYVHAKTMIVDDEYIIIGSANINQRSMDGERDTEIAMGAFQPRYTQASLHSNPKGQVYGFRMSLWAEHMGKLHKEFDQPWTLECMKSVNHSAEKEWKKYAGEEMKGLEGHLLRYPVWVGEDGSVDFIQGYETFPDLGGSPMGKYNPNLPDSLTT